MNRKKITVAAAVIRRFDGRILICQRDADTHSPLQWEFPGGKFEEGESNEECLRRELSEELGIDAEIGRCFTVVNYSYPEFDLEMHCHFVDSFEGKPKLHVHAAFEWEVPKNMKLYDFVPADIPVIDILLKEQN